MAERKARFVICDASGEEYAEPVTAKPNYTVVSDESAGQ